MILESLFAVSSRKFNRKGKVMHARLPRLLLPVALLFIPNCAYGQQIGSAKVTHDANDLSEAKMIPAAALVQLRTSKSRLIIFDVRDRDEYQVSHLAGAIHVHPLADPETLAARVARRAKGAIAVFYCTIGRRSATLAEAATSSLKARGATNVFVLTNGIIGWVNAGYPLVDKFGSTRFVHPFDKEIGKALKNTALARFTPRQKE
ncbi:MAG: rhodanese-like domain-containing protein [Hyphomicrobiaceae bacterium]